MKAFLFVIAIFSFYVSYAQETQTWIDKDGKIFEIDSELEGKLRLFPDYQEFESAKLFQLTDSTFILEINYKIDNRTNRVRKPLTAEETSAFREKVTLLINERAQYININHEGRAEFLIGTTLLGFGFWGWAIPYSMEIEDPRSNVAMYLLTSAASFFVPYWITENKPVTEAAARLSIYGGASGILHGLLLYHGLNKEPRSNYHYNGDYYYYEENNDDLAYAAVTSILETIGGYWIASSSNMTAGKAEVLTSMATMGFGYGIGFSGMAEELNSDGDWRLISLASIGAGYLAGNIIANSQNYTRGDAYALSTTGYLGAITPLALLVIGECEDGKVYSAIGIAGATAGLFLGDHLVTGKDFTTAQGVYMSLGSFAGALLGGGFGLLFSPNTEGGAKIFLTSVVAGANAGFFILYNKFKDKATIPTNSTSNLKFDFNPAAAALQFADPSFASMPVHIPCISLSYRF